MIPPRRRPTGRSRLRLGVAIWLTVISGALWARPHTRVGNLSLAAAPEWSLQVWIGSEITITPVSVSEASPFVVIFYTTPLTGTRHLLRVLLPAWPLELCAGVVAVLGLLVLAGPIGRGAHGEAGWFGTRGGGERAQRRQLRRGGCGAPPLLDCPGEHQRAGQHHASRTAREQPCGSPPGTTAADGERP